jgi:uncharacterized iron-regulated membrane protein
MNRRQRAIFWIHLCCGVVGGAVIFIMCVTGALLAFEKNIVERFESDQRYVSEGPTRIRVSEMLARVVAATPDAKPSSIAVQSDPSAAVTVAMGRDAQIFVDPYTGEITGEENSAVRQVFHFLTDLHRFIAFSGDGRPIGKAITGAFNLMFLFLALSGIYIWMPRQFTWNRLRPVVWFRRTSSGKARDFNWHNTIGFWTSLVLIVLTVTAAVISYQWAGNLVYTLTGNDPPRQQGPQGGASRNDEPFTIPANIDAIWAAAAAQSPDWRSISLRLPVGKEVVFTIDEGKSLNKFARSTLTLDAATAAVTKWEPYAELNSGRQLRSWMRFTHTGESFGLIGQFIAMIACIGGAFLVFTGLSLALRRFRAWRA